jgi:hypothetical protein
MHASRDRRSRPAPARLAARLAAVLAVVAGAYSSPAAAQAWIDSARPFERASATYSEMLFAKRFDEIDREAERLRKQPEFLSDGQDRLAALYGGISGCRTDACRDGHTLEQWRQRGQLIAEWRKLSPSSITAEMAAARYPHEHGWALRGRGMAGTVTPEGWAGFRAGNAESRRLLETASAQLKADPGWHQAMLSVAGAEGLERTKFQALYRDAAALHPLYLPIHFHGATFASPRWGGSIPELGKAVELAVERTRPRLKDVAYARLNWALSTPTMFMDGQADWARMRGAFEQLVDEFPDPWNLNNFAKFACIAGDHATVNELSARIGATAIPEAWFGDPDSYRQCAMLAYYNLIGIRATPKPLPWGPAPQPAPRAK